MYNKNLVKIIINSVTNVLIIKIINHLRDMIINSFVICTIDSNIKELMSTFNNI